MSGHKSLISSFVKYPRVEFIIFSILLVFVCLFLSDIFILSSSFSYAVNIVPQKYSIHALISAFSL
ncbi:hypothetical protein, partial [Clostridioides difficile]|uniref:hypothetical protein n=1 Tax=Clostridioides difficile TaxID=1496 RepID=UPI001A925B0A